MSTTRPLSCTQILMLCLLVQPSLARLRHNHQRGETVAMHAGRRKLSYPQRPFGPIPRGAGGAFLSPNHDNREPRKADLDDDDHVLVEPHFETTSADLQEPHFESPDETPVAAPVATPDSEDAASAPPTDALVEPHFDSASMDEPEMDSMEEPMFDSPDQPSGPTAPTPPPVTSGPTPAPVSSGPTPAPVLVPTPSPETPTRGTEAPTAVPTQVDPQPPVDRPTSSTDQPTLPPVSSAFGFRSRTLSRGSTTVVALVVTTAFGLIGCMT